MIITRLLALNFYFKKSHLIIKVIHFYATKNENVSQIHERQMHSSPPSPYQDTLRTVRESLETTSGLPVSSQTGAQVPKSQAMAVS